MNQFSRLMLDEYCNMNQFPQPMLEEYCSTAAKLDINSLWQWTNFSRGVCGLIAIPLVIYVIVKKKLVFFKEMNVILYFKAFLILWFAITSFSVNFLHTWDRLAYSNPCDWVRTTSICIPFKVSHYVSTSMTSATMFLYTVYTAITLYSKNSWWTARISYLFLGILLLLTLALSIALWFIDSEAETLHLHCLEDSIYSKPFMQVLSAVVICVDISSVTFFFVLHWYCSRELRAGTFKTLNRAFLLRHTLLNLQTYLPLTLLHSVAFLTFNSAFAVLRLYQKENPDRATLKTWHGICNIVPYYCVAFPLLLMYLSAKLIERRHISFSNAWKPTREGAIVPADVLYFETLKKQLN